MKLTETEKNSDLWRKIRGYMEQRLSDYRAMNDGSWDEAETARLRGRIAEVKALLLLDHDEPKIETEMGGE